MVFYLTLTLLRQIAAKEKKEANEALAILKSTKDDSNDEVRSQHSQERGVVRIADSQQLVCAKEWLRMYGRLDN